MTHTLLFQVFRRLDRSYEQFREHWLEVHAPLGSALPGIEAYDIYIAGEDPERLTSDPDGFVVMQFPSVAAGEAAMGSEQMARAVEDAALFADHFAAFPVTAHQVVPSDR